MTLMLDTPVYIMDFKQRFLKDDTLKVFKGIDEKCQLVVSIPNKPDKAKRSRHSVIHIAKECEVIYGFLFESNWR